SNCATGACVIERLKYTPTHQKRQGKRQLIRLISKGLVTCPLKAPNAWVRGAPKHLIEAVYHSFAQMT
ncbi:MAG TPA: hypothetical protein PKK09_04980, partial [Anaerolineaceae bacterium]|nr:hypothetical protein [Anaerolineaceae bacterium]